jgi:hydrogenase maturation protein HypF
MMSQHVGDLDTPAADDALRHTAAGLQTLYEARPEIIACDAHPDYRSTRFALEAGRPVVRVQHHVAHVLACMAENQLTGRALGVSWDGTGFGPDGTIWGGEFLLVDDHAVRRVAHLRTFPLPGGERAAREPRRSATGLLYAARGDAAFRLDHLPSFQAFSASERLVLRRMLRARLNSPVTSSVGRLFDAVASLIGLRQFAGFEGQAAMELEFASQDTGGDVSPYPFPVQKPPGGGALVVDWESAVEGILADFEAGASPGAISAAFHAGLADAIAAVAGEMGALRVVLTGGCFQNRYLVELAVARLRDRGFTPYWHQRIPPNDGGISAGQAMAVHRAASGLAFDIEELG